MVRVVVAGKAKGVGKTAIIKHILKNLKAKIGVIKCSIHSNISEPVVTDNPEIIERDETDTALYSRRGADRVIYVQSNYRDLGDSFDKAGELVGDNDYLLIEGNSILDYINPDLIIYLKKENIDKKPSAVKARKKSDIIIDFQDFIEHPVDFSLQVNGGQLTCFKAHLLSELFNRDLTRIGDSLTQEGVKIINCQLGLF